MIRGFTALNLLIWGTKICYKDMWTFYYVPDFGAGSSCILFLVILVVNVESSTPLTGTNDPRL